MPSPSYFPLVAAFGLPVMGYGMVYGRSSGQSYVVVVLGALILLGGLFAWAMEPSAEPEEEGQEVIEPATDDQPALVTAGGEEPAPAPAPAPEESGS